MMQEERWKLRKLSYALHWMAKLFTVFPHLLSNINTFPHLVLNSPLLAEEVIFGASKKTVVTITPDRI